jgi:hypothetical protein
MVAQERRFAPNARTIYSGKYCERAWNAPHDLVGANRAGMRQRVKVCVSASFANCREENRRAGAPDFGFQLG